MSASVWTPDSTPLVRDMRSTPRDLQGLAEVGLNSGRPTFEGVGIEPFDGTASEVDVESGRLAVNGRGHFPPVDYVPESDAQPLRHPVGGVLHLAGSGNAKSGVAGGGAIGVGVESAAVVDALEAVMVRVPGYLHYRHHVFPAGHRASGEASGENLGHGAEVRVDSQDLLQTARTPAGNR